MAGIAGINMKDSVPLVQEALRKLEHRGLHENTIVLSHTTTQGQTTRSRENIVDSAVVLDGNITNWRELSPSALTVYDAIWDSYLRKGPQFVCQLHGSFALSIATGEGHFLARDPLGIAPLYVGTSGGRECFASEPKALIGWAQDIREFPPGCYSRPWDSATAYYRLEKHDPLDISPETAATTLRELLSQSVQRSLAQQSSTGILLSGGLDSSALAVSAREYLDHLETFTVGMQGGEDLERARPVVRTVQSDHHEMIVTPRDIATVLPDVIYCLEMFEPAAVRQGAMSFLAARLASDHVPAVLGGDGADELFGGYEYLKEFEPIDLDAELLRLTGRLHEDTLRRSDRCSAVHGITAHLPFLDRRIVRYAFLTAPGYKVWDGQTKWLLRQSMYDLLPSSILREPKSGCWDSDRAEAAMARYADELISDEEFARERRGCAVARLRSKEECYYYRIFREHFGEDVTGATEQGRGIGVA